MVGQSGQGEFRIELHGQGVDLGGELGAVVETRLRSDLRSHASRIVVAHVRIWVPGDAPGPVICHVRVELRRAAGSRWERSHPTSERPSPGPPNE